MLPIPISVLTDSYKASHFALYPKCNKMVAYGEFRAPYSSLEDDSRMVIYGIRYIVENYLNKRWTMEDVQKADLFYNAHNAGFTSFPFPKDLFTKFVKENDGYFPIKLEALPEGTVAYPHVPVFQITAEGEYTPLVTFLETLLTMVWYPSTVATLSRRARQLIEDSFKRTVDDDSMWKVESRLHDFGFRGCTCVEQSVIGGIAHLLNFRGSDTMSACYYAQFYLNNGKPVAQSIPATEHSVMTSWRSEQAAIENMIERFGAGVYSCVMDSYDYTNALNKVLPAIASKKVGAGGFMVCRPDSGDPVDAVLEGLRAEEKVFGVDINKKGFKVIRGASVIQGDGINIHTIAKILKAIEAEGYAAECVAFGMGGGLLQKVNRDTMSFATKLNFIRYADGTERDVMKLPKTDKGKCSLPGPVKVVRDPKTNVPMVYPLVDPSANTTNGNGNGNGNSNGVHDSDNLLKVVYDHRPVDYPWETFDAVRQRVDDEWHRLPPHANVISKELQNKIEATIQLYRSDSTVAKD